MRLLQVEFDDAHETLARDVCARLENELDDIIF
jgi:hypothetical protein